MSRLRTTLAGGQSCSRSNVGIPLKGEPAINRTTRSQWARQLARLEWTCHNERKQHRSSPLAIGRSPAWYWRLHWNTWLPFTRSSFYRAGVFFKLCWSYAENLRPAEAGKQGNLGSSPIDILYVRGYSHTDYR